VIAVDTNILLRYLVQDEAAQAVLANDLIENKLSAARPGFIAITVLIETVWVLQRRYRQSTAEIRSVVARLLEAPQIVVDQSAVVKTALALDHPDLADAVVHAAGRANGCERTLTFDRQFARVAGVDLLTA
jgi:predicted nucleic-acid-binding protein